MIPFSKSLWRSVLLWTCLAVAPGVGLAAAAAAPQTVQTDPRWNPWLGCWTSDRVGEFVCVVPGATTSAVDLVTVANGRVLSRETVDSSGARRETTRSGCTGWEVGRWSKDGRRLFLESEHRCADASPRTGNEIIALAPSGDWLDIISISIGSNTGVQAIQRRVVTAPADLPAEVAAVLPARLRERNTTLPPAVGMDEVIDASRQSSGPVVKAWLNVVHPRLKADSRQLRDLSRSGVPNDVIDTIVALAYPNAFPVENTPTHVLAAAPVPASTPVPVTVVPAPIAAPTVVMPVTPVTVVPNPVIVTAPPPTVIYAVDPVYVRQPARNCLFDPYAWDYCPGWRPTPEVIIVTPPRPEPPHGRVTKDNGYTAGDSNGSRTAKEKEPQTNSAQPAASSDPDTPTAPAPRTARPK